MSAIDFLSDDSLPSELRTISVKLSDFRQQFIDITGLFNTDVQTVDADPK